MVLSQLIIVCVTKLYAFLISMYVCILSYFQDSLYLFNSLQWIEENRVSIIVMQWAGLDLHCPKNMFPIISNHFNFLKIHSFACVII